MQLRTSLVCLGFLALTAACGEKGNGDDDGNGGSSSTGGKGSAGSSTSGSSNTSGSTGGGSDAGGTESGKAGMPATGEGGSGTGGGTTKSYTFDTAVEGFVVSDSSAAEEVEPVTKADIMLSHNDAEGEPEPGSLQMEIPFSLASQYVSAGVDTRPPSMRAETDPGPNMTGKTITAWVRIESGYGEAEDLMTAPGNAKLYAKTGPEYVYGSAAVANLTEVGVWVQLTFEVDFPGYTAADSYDPADVREIGIQFDTNSASTTAAPAVVLIDTISY